ncbi:MAG: hypothetical protein AAF205_00430 [Pseudomonadota bacterium]
MKKYIPIVATLFVCFVFIQSLFFKFAGGAPEPAHIFGTLDEWAAGFGLGGWFANDGIFGRYAIGTVELIASTLLLLALLPAMRKLRPFGALIGLGTMTGAIFFHLFTPLGIEVLGDGGTLFIMACITWLCCLYLLVTSRHLVLGGGTVAHA